MRPTGIVLATVLYAALVAGMVLGEIPSPIQVLGGALIVAGVVLIRFSSGATVVGLPTATAELDPTG